MMMSFSTFTYLVTDRRKTIIYLHECVVSFSPPECVQQGTVNKKIGRRAKKEEKFYFSTLSSFFFLEFHQTHKALMMNIFFILTVIVARRRRCSRCEISLISLKTDAFLLSSERLFSAILYVIY
jgi:hypothetical protein